MQMFVVALHIVLCLILIGTILLQPGKGADPGSAFGGGMTSTMFGPRGPANVLSRATTAVAVLFMVTSVTLALYSSKRVMTDYESEMERLQREQSEAAAPAPPAGPQAPGDMLAAPMDEATPADEVPVPGEIDMGASPEDGAAAPEQLPGPPADGHP
jgi:preprotein translocase subunit SecG